jgi:SAM-dependent methyltransferase
MAVVNSAAPWGKSHYWQERFSVGDTPWELGAPSAVLFEAVSILSQEGFDLKGKRVLSPGCGRGSDALELAKRGARVTAVDWSINAIEDLKGKVIQHQSQLAGELHAECGDFFNLKLDRFDLVCEHTFFCAIDPSMRPKYLERIAQLVKVGGYLIGNFFIVSKDEGKKLENLSLAREGQGPPFGATPEELLSLVGPYFDTELLRQASHGEPGRRPGMEWVGIFKRRD